MTFIQRQETVLVIIDMQERLLPAIPEDRRASVVRNALIAIEAARVLTIPVVVSEQYPKGLGPTIADVRDRLGEQFAPIEKLAFSCGRSAEFKEALQATGRQDVLLMGVEAHVCVLQTAVDLLNAGYRVFVAADGIASRRLLDYDRAIALLDKSGAIVGTTEMFLFQILERAGTDEFKAISKLVR